jgi:hypothetical protein
MAQHKIPQSKVYITLSLGTNDPNELKLSDNTKWNIHDALEKKSTCEQFEF